MSIHSRNDWTVGLTGRPLEDALAAAQVLLARHSEETVERVELDRSGGIAIRTSQGRWLNHGEAGFSELDPAADSRLGLSALLRASQSARQCRVLAYRPGRRMVVRRTVNGADHVLKGYPAGKASTASSRLILLDRALSGAPLKAPSHLRFLDEYGCIEMPWIEGRRLEILASAASAFDRIGRSIRSMQQSGEAHTPLPRHDRAAELDVLEERRRRLGLVSAEPPADWPALAARLEEAKNAVSATPAVLCHRDLHDGQFLHAERDILLLDADLLCLAEPELDIANLVAHLALRQLQDPARVRQKDVDACARKLLRGYNRSEDPEFWARLRWYQASAFARLALVYDLRPRWKPLCPQLTVLGQRCLDDLERLVSIA